MTIQVQVTMPSVPGSRSNTVEGGGSNVGVEIGKDYENNVKRMVFLQTWMR